MLDPEYLSSCTDEIVELYSKLDEKITRDIARRLVKTGTVTDTAKMQTMIAQESGKLYDEIITDVAKITGSSEESVKAVFKDAGIKSVSFDNEIYERAGLSPKALNKSPAAMKILEAGVIKTNGLLSNLTQTTADVAQQAYIDACTLAELQVSSGAFDYNTAIKNAVDSAISEGNFVQYPSGHKDRLDVAVRRSVLTGVSQTTGEISLAYVDDMGTDLMEINAHGGARPSHAVWQGKIVCISGKKHGYKTLKEIGYGTGEGFKGWNCRHDWYPYIEGISTRAYSDKQLKELNNRSVSYKDKTYTQYEAEQLQRSLERSIRESKRKLSGYDEALKSTDSDDMSKEMQAEFDFNSLQLKEKEKAYKDFCEQTGLSPYNDRLQSHGFNKDVSRKAISASKKKLPSVARTEDTKLSSTLFFTSEKGIEGIVPQDAYISDVRVIAGYGTSTDLRVAKSLSENYGGNSLLWEKKGGIITTDNRIYDVHWYEYNGKQYEPKLKSLKEVK